MWGGAVRGTAREQRRFWEKLGRPSHRRGILCKKGSTSPDGMDSVAGCPAPAWCCIWSLVLGKRLEQDPLLLRGSLVDKQYWKGLGREPGGDRIRATLVLRCQDVVQRTSGCVHLQMSGMAAGRLAREMNQ